jgi:hypothetical protein
VPSSGGYSFLIYRLSIKHSNKVGGIHTVVLAIRKSSICAVKNTIRFVRTMYYLINNHISNTHITNCSTA